MLTSVTNLYLGILLSAYLIKLLKIAVCVLKILFQTEAIRIFMHSLIEFREYNLFVPSPNSYYILVIKIINYALERNVEGQLKNIEDSRNFVATISQVILLLEGDPSSFTRKYECRKARNLSDINLRSA